MMSMKIKELFEQGKYDEVISSMDKDFEKESLLFLVASYCAKDNYEKALEIILKYRKEMFEENPLLTMKYNFEIRYALKEFDEAYEDLSFYSSLPYVRQEVEEYLRELPKEVRNREKESFISRKMSIEEIGELLEKAKTNEDYLNALSKCRDKDVSPIVDNLEKILVSSLHKDIRTYALLLLVASKIDKQVKFLYEDEVLLVNPSKLKPPFVDENFKKIEKELSLLNNPSLSEIAMQLLSSYIICLYPKDFAEVFPIEKLSKAFLNLAKDYLRIHNDEEDKEIKDIEVRIEETLRKNPPLSL